MIFLPKSFIETAEGLLFAIVAEGLESEKVRCFLRYVRNENGQWRKVQTDEANDLLAKNYPDYLFHSTEFDADLHAVSVEKIVKNYNPYARLKELFTPRKRRDAVEKDCVALCKLFEKQYIELDELGVTGSILVGLQNESSDIDLICDNISVFHQCRLAILELTLREKLDLLTEQDWRESYNRRDCELSFEEYVWHEVRKCNKGLINGRKFDLSLVESDEQNNKTYKKLGAIALQATVSDDSRAFCYPAEFKISHSTIQSVVCFTATYTGQAIVGEIIEVAGQLEQDECGNQRIVVGSSREARGEYIKVTRQSCTSTHHLQSIIAQSKSNPF
jgi:predicted nucleotidyltransferase